MILLYPWHVGYPKRRPKEFAELAEGFEWIEFVDCLRNG